MKAVAEKIHRKRSDFYSSTIAPLYRYRQVRIRIMDVGLLTVLFLELAVVIRFVLAN
jgi:hypothetical protein